MCVVFVVVVYYCCCFFRSRRKEVGEEILDLLASFSDFLIFKQTVLEYKAVRMTIILSGRRCLGL